MTTDKKKTKWSYDRSIATVLFPDKVTADYDVSLITEPKVKDFLLHYGFKQFLSDKIAGIGKGATSADKLEVFNERYNMLIAGEITKKTERAKLVSEAVFVEMAIAEGATEEFAKKMFELARKAQK